MISPPVAEPSTQTPPSYVCYRAPALPASGALPGAPVVDGRLDKPFWSGAPWSEAFVDIEGDVRARPRFKTRFKMLWDETCLYVGAELEEPDVWATLRAHDSIVFHDNDFEVFLNPTGDNHRYYEIEVNALNTIFDLFLPKPYRDGGPADHGWDVKGLRTAVHIDGTLNDPTDRDRGWTVEMAFPWSAFDRHGAIKCPPRDGDQWRVNFSRVEWDVEAGGGAYRKIEGMPEHNWVWSAQGVIDMHRPERWGYVEFSSQGAGNGKAGADESFPAREWLHHVYYAQGRYRAAHGRWAERVDQLELPPGTPVGERTLTVDGEAWKASCTVGTGVGKRTWWIREDSLVGGS